MGRGVLIGLVFIASLARTASAQDPFEGQRQAALAQVAWVQQAYAERLGPKGAEWRARIRSEEPALTGALDWFTRNAEGDQALRLARPLAYFWSYDGRTEDARALLTRILSLPSAAAPTAVRAQALYDAGTLAFRGRDQASARALTDQSVRIARKLQDKDGIATALLGLARVAFRDMDYASVRRYAEESGVISRELGDSVAQAAAVHMLASVARVQGQYDKAAELYKFSLDANRAAGWDGPAAAEVFNLGYVRLRQGKTDAAKALFTESLGKYRDAQDETGVALVLTGFASIAVEQKQPAKAARLYAAALGILDEFNVLIDPDDQFDIDHYTAKLLTLMPASAFDAASNEGRKTSPERAIALALETR